MTVTPPPPRLPATTRILDAAAACIVSAGVAAVSMQDVADAAGVSKALIHYHFHDKRTLLCRLVERVTRELLARQQAALAGSTPQSAIDDLWGWVADELRREHLRVLGELAQERAPDVRGLVRDSLRVRREAAATSIARLFVLLDLRPRVPTPLLADVFVAFLDGLAVHVAIAPEGGPRVVFDAFWLSLLSLAE